jgi:hypothetical protein
VLSSGRPWDTRARRGTPSLGRDEPPAGQAAPCTTDMGIRWCDVKGEGVGVGEWAATVGRARCASCHFSVRDKAVPSTAAQQQH